MSYLQRLDELGSEATLNDIRLAVHERQTEQVAHGASAIPFTEFWDADMLNLYRQAQEWWPKDAPIALQLPTLRELCIGSTGTSDTVPLPAREALNILGSKCVQWLESEGRDPQHPNETRQQAQRRRAVAAMQRSRALKRQAGTNPAAERVRGLHAAYIEACRARKAAAAEHDDRVEAARREWEAAKADLAAGSAGSALDAGAGVPEGATDGA